MHLCWFKSDDVGVAEASPAFSRYGNRLLTAPAENDQLHHSDRDSVIMVLGKGSKKTDGKSTDPAKATEEKRVPAPLRERKGKKQEGKDLRTPSSNLKPARSPTEVDWSSFPEGSYTRFGHGGDWWTFLKGTLAILTVWATWLGGGTSPVWMACLYMHGYRVAFWILLGPLLYPLFLPVPAWPAFVRFVLDMAGYFEVRIHRRLRGEDKRESEAECGRKCPSQ